MAKDFSETGIEYNWGFIDGLLWVLNSGNKIGMNEIIAKVQDIRKANDEIMNGDERRVTSLLKTE